MAMYLSLFTLLCSVAVALNGHHLFEFENNEFELDSHSVITKKFEQQLDHFDRQQSSTFQQRFYMNSQFHGSKSDPIFVYIGGEGALSPLCIGKGEIVDNARIHNAMLFGLEHRYYGLSNPFDTHDTHNLQWLSSQQALADLAHFIVSMKIRFFLDGPVVTFGGSYPGALSAWFRLKYPHVTAGSLASSAPILAKTDFFEYDQAIASAAGPDCADSIRKATSAVESALDTDANATMHKFTCVGISEGDFLYVIADAVAYSIQYTSDRPGSRYHLREDLCDTVGDAAGDPVDNYAKFVAGLFAKINSSCDSFTSILPVLQNTKTGEYLAQRQWYYQSCTEFGFFQVAAPQNPLRSSKVNLQYHLDLCKQAFNITMKLLPTIQFTNSFYGGLGMAGSNIFFVNGGIDPWRKLSLLTNPPKEPTIHTRVVKGTSHCADLYAKDSADPNSLVAARVEIADSIADWLRADHDDDVITSPWFVWTLSIITVVSVICAVLALCQMRRTKNGFSRISEIEPPIISDEQPLW